MKKLLAIILAVALIGILAACTQAPAPTATTAPTATPTATAAPAAPTEMAVFAATEPESIDPAKSAWVHEATLIAHMFEGLMRWDVTVPGAKPVLGNATDIKWDGLKATVTLRDGLVWNDGKPLTAKDYEFAWKRHADASLATAYGSTMIAYFKGGMDAYNAVQKAIDDKATYDLKTIQDGIAIKATDDKTLTFELASPCGYFDYILAFPCMVPVREDTITANGDKWTQTPDTYICNGRYVMSERKPNELIQLKKNDKYWDKDSTKMEIIDFKLLKDEIAAYAAYQTDEICFTNNIPLGEMETALKSPDYISTPLLGLYYYDFNVKKKPLDNAKVRQALALAIDKKYIVTTVTKQNQIPAYGIVPEGIMDAGEKTFREVAGNMLEADYEKAVAQAKQLLADAGYKDGKGLPKIEVSYNSNSQGHKNIAEAITNMWKEKLGINAALNPVEGSVFNSYRMKLEHQVARDGWIMDWADPSNMLDLFKKDSGNNHTGWSNETFEAKMIEAANSTDQAVRMAAFHVAEQTAIADMPVAPIYYYTNNFMLKPYVDGICFSPLGNIYFWNCTLTK